MKLLRFLLIIILISSCDLLETRDPEEPSQSRSSFQTPTSPDILFENLRNSFKDKIVENYIACFANSSFIDKEFSFTPAVEVAQNFVSWNLESEKQYFQNLSIASEENTSMTLSLIEKEVQPHGDFSIYLFDYVLSIISSDERVPDFVKGSAMFTVYLDSRQQWVITDWTDYQEEGFVSWSEIKNRFY